MIGEGIERWFILELYFLEVIFIKAHIDHTCISFMYLCPYVFAKVSTMTKKAKTEFNK